MNWEGVIRFKKQVEELVREELLRAEWEKREHEAKREALRQEMESISRELERHMRLGIGKIFAEQRFQWLEAMGASLEQIAGTIQQCDDKIAGLRDKLREAHQARRVLETIYSRKQAVLVKALAKQEQISQDEATAVRYAHAPCEDMV